MISLAAHQFAWGLRAYYFGLSMLAWFIHPGFFVLATTGVVLVLYAAVPSSVLEVMLYTNADQELPQKGLFERRKSLSCPPFSHSQRS